MQILYQPNLPQFGRKYGRSLLIFLAILVLFGLTAVPQAFTTPVLTATKTDSLITDNDSDGVADPGDTIRYTVTVANSGTTDATNTSLVDTVDANTTLVGGSLKSTPIARNDSYTSLGNVGITVPASGVLANDNDPDLQPVSAVAAAGATTNGGTFALAADGSFSYLPAAGFEGEDSFTYTIQDTDSNTDTATVLITVNEVIWFVNKTSSAGGTGRIDNPFKDLTGINEYSSAADDPDDIIFLYDQRSAGDYSGGITLKNNQILIGQGATASIATIAGITIPPFSRTLPGTNLTRPVIVNSGGNGITLASGNTIRGLNVGSSLTTGISGSSVGNLTISEAAINAGSGGGIDINTGSLNVTLDSVTSVGGTTPGIKLQTTTGSFTVTGSASSCSSAATCAGGSIRNKSGDASGTSNGTDGIFLNSVENVKLTAMHIASNNRNGIYGNIVNGLQLDNCMIESNANQVSPNEAGLYLRELTGDNTHLTTIKNSTVRNSYEHNVDIQNSSGTLTLLEVTGSTFAFTNNTGFLGQDFLLAGTNTAVVNLHFEGNTADGFKTGATSNTVVSSSGLKTDIGGSGSMDVTVINNTFTDNNAGIDLGVSSGTASFTFDVLNNATITQNRAVGINVFTNAGSNSSVIGTIKGNTVGTQSVTASGSYVGSGIDVGNEGSGTLTVLIDNNTVQSVGGIGFNGFEGIVVAETVSTSNGTVNATITGNTLRDIIDDRGLNTFQNNSGTICTNITSNQFLGTQGGTSNIRLGQVSGGTHNNVQTSAANISSLNNSATVSTSGTINFGAPACPLPPSTTLAAVSLGDKAGQGSIGPEAVVESASSEPIESTPVPIVKGGTAAKQVAVPTLSAETVNLSLGTLNAGQVVTITFNVTVDSTIPANVTQVCNQGQLSGGNFTNILTDDPDTGTVDDATCTAVPQANLRIAKSDSADVVSPGSNFTYTLTVNNDGPSSAQNVVVTDTLPAGVSYVTDDCGMSGTPGPVVTWTIGSLISSGSATCNITVTAPSTQTVLTNSASVASTTRDPVTSNNSASEDTIVGEAVDLIVTKTESIDPVIAGSGSGNLTYVVTVKNDGPFAATGVDLSEVMTLPAGVAIDSVTPGAGTSYAPPNAASGTWTVGSLAVNQSKTLTVVLTAAANTAVGTDTISNTAAVTASDKPLINTGDDSATESTSVAREVDLQLTKTESIDPVGAGSGVGNLTHIVTVKNDGPSDATNVVINEAITIPAGVTIDSITPSQGSHTLSAGSSSTNGTWTVGSLAKGASETLTIVYTVGSSAAAGTDVISDTASVNSASETLINTGDDSVTEATSIVVKGSVILIKDVTSDNGGQAGINDFGLNIGGTAVNSGDTLDFTPGTEVAINETGLAGYAFVEITGTGCPAALGGKVTVQAGVTTVCTIKNDDIAPRLKVVKKVIGFGGPHSADDFTMKVSATDVSSNDFPGSESGTVVTLDAGSYSVSESGPDGYTAALSTACSGSIAIGQEKICTVTNTAKPAKIKVNKDADPSEVWEPGGDVEFIIDVRNSGPVRPVTVTEIDDSYFGDLEDECDLPFVIPAGQTFTCRFTEFIGGGGGDIHYNQVKVTAKDQDGNVLTDTSDEDVHILDIPSSLKVSKDAAKSEVQEPGENLLFTLKIKNTSQVDKVTIKKVVDTKFGDLTADCLPSGPKTLSVGESFICDFTRFIGGQSGDVHSNTVTVSGTDDDGKAVSDSAFEQVQIDNVPSSIKVNVAADPQQVYEPGDDVTYTVEIKNSSTADDVAINQVSDDVYGDLVPACLPTGPVTLAPGLSHICSFTRFVGGQAGDKIDNLVSASGIDDDGFAVSDSAGESVQILDTPSSLSVTKTVEPQEVAAPGGDVTFTVTILNDSTADNVLVEHFVDTGQPEIGDNCTPALPILLQPGQSITCTLTTYIGGRAGDVYTSRAAASGTDDDGYPVSALSEVTVKVVHPPSGYTIFLPSISGQ